MMKFVWAQSALSQALPRSQARSAWVIARRRRVLIRLKAERFILACVIARRRRALPPRGTKTSTPTAEGRWSAANLLAKLVYYIWEKKTKPRTKNKMDDRGESVGVQKR